ncbi:uncharacterized protein TNCV_730751 [Trichonephila clavipes]|nr:uncharacterized protein TNCV_730751 [Trichonephila clavipes]
MSLRIGDLTVLNVLIWKAFVQSYIEKTVSSLIFAHQCRYNFELYRLYKEPQVTQLIRSNRLRWLGHIWRSPENNQTSAYTFKNPRDLEQEEDHQQGG